MKPLFPLFSLLGLLGFVASLVAHCYGLLKQPSPFGGWVWALHVGIFPLFFALISCVPKTKPNDAKRDNVTELMKELPLPVRVVMSVIFGYAILNFVLFMYQTSQYPKKAVPEWLAQRGFSGHWMVFYGVIFCGFWGLYLNSKKNEIKKS